MTINEFQIQLDLNQDNRAKWLNDFAFKQSNCFLFADSNDGQCYLFSEDGNQIDISNLELIETGTFWNCASLTSIIIPDSVESIGNHAFAHCTSLTSIQIPDSVKSIEDEAFYYCTSLKSIKIPDSVESLEYRVFDSCRSLNEVLFKGKTMDKVKEMDYYPWAIEDESIIKCS